jgi:hypothetical protein
MSATGLLMNVGLGLGAASWAARLAGVAVVVACALAVRRGGDERLLFTGTVSAALIASPIVWSHYLLLLLVPVLVVSASPEPTHPAGSPWRRSRWRRSRWRGRPLAADAPVAAFTAGSWIVVTPHRSDWLDVAVATVVVAFLTLPPLLAAATGLFRRQRPPNLRRLLAPAAGATVAAAAATGTCLALRLMAASRGDEARVVGAYCALLGVVAILGWAAFRTRRSGRRAAGAAAT